MATILTNSFEGVTPSGTTLTQGAGGNTGGASGSFFDAITIGASATLASDSAHAAHGSLSCKVATTTSTNDHADWSTSVNAAATQVWWRLYLYFTANPGANVRVMAVTNAGVLVAGLIINTSGQLVANFGSAGTTATTSTATIPLNAWFRVEGFVKISATVGQTEVKLFTSPDSTSPTETDTSTANQDNGTAYSAIRYGVTVSTASAGPFWMDDLGYSDTGYLGPATSAVTGTLTPALPAPRTALAGTVVPAGPFRPVLPTPSTTLASIYGPIRISLTAIVSPPVSGTLGPLTLPAPAAGLRSGEPVEKLLVLPQNQLMQVVWADSRRGKPVTKWLIVNRDIINPIRAGYDTDRQVPDLQTPDPNVTSVIDPLSCLAVEAGQDWWALSPYGDVMIDIIPNATYWAPSPAQTAFQLQALGLMLNSTGVGIAKGIGTPDGVNSVPLTEALSLGGTASIASAQQMLDANQGVTTELAALIASGSPSGSPGGVPLIIGATPLIQQAGAVNLGAGTTTTLGPFVVGQIAYEIYLELQETTAGTSGATVSVSLSWVDSGTGLQLGLETYNILPASPTSTAAHTVHGRGPSRGDQLTITITNNDTVNVAALMNVLETSRVYSVGLWQTFQSQTGLKFTGMTDTAFYPPSKVIADSLQTVNAGNVLQRVLPFYTGQAKLLLIAETAAMAVTINTLDPLVSNLGQIYQLSSLPAGSRTYTDIMFGNSQCLAELGNTDTKTGTIGMEITAYPW